MTLPSWRIISSSHIATTTIPPSSLIADPPKCRRERAAPKCSKEVESVQPVFIIAATRTMFQRPKIPLRTTHLVLETRKSFHLSAETAASSRKTAFRAPNPLPAGAPSCMQSLENACLKSFLYAQKLCRNAFGRVIGSYEDQRA